MGIPVSHLNNKLRKPLVWRLDGRAPAKFHLYKQDSAKSDTLSIRKDSQLFAMPHHTRDVTSGSVPRATRRLRRKRRQRAVTSRGESSSSDTDERASGVSERDIEVYLTESSLECPANVPLVLSTPCILYQTTPAGVQEELPLQLGLIVTGIFQHQNWVYVQTPHDQEGYVLHKHCLPLCILPVQKVNSSKRGNVTSWKTSDSILEHIEDLKRPGGKPYEGQFVEALKDYNGCFAEVDGLPHERWDPSLAESEQMLLDWNRNQVMSEDVFDHLNGLGGDCVYQNNVERRAPEKWTYRSVRCIDEILAELVGTEKSLTEDVSDNFENTRCESAFTDGGYFMDDIGMGKEIFGILPNEIFGEMQSNCLSSGNSVDQSNVNADCKYGGVAYDHGLQGWRNGVYTELDITSVEQHQNPYGKSKKCGSRAQPANGVPENCRGEEKSNQCVCCFENCSTHQDSKSESSANISKDFKSPRYSSTPVGKPQYNSNHDVRKTKKHCSTYCAHERVQQPSVEVPNKSEDKQRNMDDSTLRSNENPPGKQYHQHGKETHSFANVDFTSQYSWKPIQKIFPDGSHSCSNKNFDSNTSNSTREYKFQTIEILQEPGRKESFTSDCKPGNRIKKPCFKIHNKIEVRTNSAGLLTDIVEDEVDHQVDQNVQNKLDQNHDRCNNGSSLLKNETQINKKSKASPTITCDRYTTNNELKNKGSPTVSTITCDRYTTNNELKNKGSTTVSTITCDRYTTNNELKNKGSPTVSTRNSLKDSIDSRTFDTLSTASFPLRRKSTKPTLADSISLCSELYIDDFFIRRRSRKKLPRDEPVRHKPLMLITEDYYNADGGFQVLKDEIVVLLNIYKSWLYVQTQKQQNGFIPSYIAAYAVV